MQNADVSEALNFIKKQFLCNAPIRDINFKQLLNDSVEAQRLIIENTVSLPLILQYPVKIDYQKAFLKAIIQYLEKQGSVIDDCVFEEYGRLVALPSNDDPISNYKHYIFGNQRIVLKESVSLISNGTTGLRTWQAALALSEWLVKNSDKFENQTILELGSGVGLTGLVLAAQCARSTIYLTDCHYAVLQTLCDNIKLNVDPKFKSKSCTVINNNNCLLEESLNSCSVRVLRLSWEEINCEISSDLGAINKVIAADIVYDEDLFTPLIQAINNLFNYSGVEEFILSCTERNKDTLSKFISLLRSENRYRLETLEVPAQSNFLWSTETPVKIFSVSSSRCLPGGN